MSQLQQASEEGSSLSDGAGASAGDAASALSPGALGPAAPQHPDFRWVWNKYRYVNWKDLP
jgi:hypothetical protein